MAQMRPCFQKVTWVLFAVYVMAGCSQPAPATLLQPTNTRSVLAPYLTPTAIVPSPTMTPVKSLPVTPAPSPTPFTHVVVKGETMLGIALRYGVTLEALQAANPSIDPQFLSVDTALIVPLGDEIAVTAATPTPVPVEWDEPVCYRTADDGAWCFVLVENKMDTALENLSAWIGLFGNDGEIIASQVAVGPINILRSRQAMPLMAYFQPPLPADIAVRAELLTAISIPEDDERYLDWPLADLAIEIMGDMLKEARVTGRIMQPEDTTSPGQVWIAAIAYDQSDQVVGVRKLENTDDLVVDLTVYSLGPAIARVEVLIEIRP